MALIEPRRSLVFNYSSKDSNDVVTSYFNKFPNPNPIEIIDNLLSKYDPLQIEELIIEEQEIYEISDQLKMKIQDLQHLESLGINRCKLKTIVNLPYLKFLQRLTLDGNEIKVHQISYIFERYPDLLSLSLVKNNLHNTSFKEFVEIISKTQITQLTIFDNEIVSKGNFQDNYAELFRKCPKLQIVDNMRRTGEQVFYEADEEILNLELSRNDGEDLRGLQKVLKTQGEAAFKWTTGDHRSKGFDINRKEGEIEQKQTEKKANQIKNKSFKNEMEDDDEDDEEFEPFQAGYDDDDEDLRNTNSEMEEEDNDEDQ